MHLIVGRTGYSRVCVCVTAVVVMLHLGTSLCRPFYQASASLIALTFSTIVVKKSTFQRQFNLRNHAIGKRWSPCIYIRCRTAVD
jgi:hypothetical protein